MRYRYLLPILLVLAACGDSTTPTAFDVTVDLRRQIGGPPCGWFWSAEATDDRPVDYTVTIGSGGFPGTRAGQFQSSVTVMVPEPGYAFSAGTYDYRWSIQAGAFERNSAAGSVTCP